MKYYDKIAKGYNELYGAEQIKKARLLKQHLKINGLLLDIGAGTGIATEEFKSQATCVLLDPSLEMLRKAQGLRVCATAEHLPFKKRTFGAIISLTALHHANMKKALKEINRIAGKNTAIGISILKRSSAIKANLLRKWKKIEEEKDVLFISSGESSR